MTDVQTIRVALCDHIVVADPARRAAGSSGGNDPRRSIRLYLGVHRVTHVRAGWIVILAWVRTVIGPVRPDGWCGRRAQWHETNRPRDSLRRQLFTGRSLQ